MTYFDAYCSTLLSVDKINFNVFCKIENQLDPNEKDSSKQISENDGLFFSNLTLNDAVKDFMNLIKNTDHVGNITRKKRDITIQTCFDLILVVDDLFNILSSDSKDYNISQLSVLSNLLDHGSSKIACQCYPKEKDFISYQLGIINQELWKFQSFVMANFYESQTTDNPKKQNLNSSNNVIVKTPKPDIEMSTKDSNSVETETGTSQYKFPITGGPGKLFQILICLKILIFSYRSVT